MNIKRVILALLIVAVAAGFSLRDAENPSVAAGFSLRDAYAADKRDAYAADKGAALVVYSQYSSSDLQNRIREQSREVENRPNELSWYDAGQGRLQKGKLSLILLQQLEMAYNASLFLRLEQITCNEQYYKCYPATYSYSKREFFEKVTCQANCKNSFSQIREKFRKIFLSFFTDTHYASSISCRVVLSRIFNWFCASAYAADKGVAPGVHPVPSPSASYGAGWQYSSSERAKRASREVLDSAFGLARTVFVEYSSSLSRRISDWFCPPVYAADKGNPPVAHWRFDECGGPTAYDESTNNNDGTLQPGTGGTNTAVGQMWTTQGKIGGALECDGTDDYVSAPRPSSFDATAGTISLWIKPNFNGNDNAKYIIFDTDGGSYTWIAKNSDNYIWFFYNHGAGKAISAKVPCSSIVAGNWYHIIVRWNISTLLDNGHYAEMRINNSLTGAVYRDDVAIGTLTAATLYLGKQGTSVNNGEILTANYFSGLIDDVRIYNYARTQAQIAWDYNRGKPVGHWRFNEGSGTTAYDESDNNNDGTITIGATGTQTTIGAAWTNGASGKFGKCMSFDGTDDWVNCGTNISQSTERTYTWWHKISANGSAVFPSPIAYGGYSEGFRAIWRDDTDDKLQIQVTTGTYTTPTFSLQSPSVDQVGVWYHYAMTYDGVNTGKLYRNGALVDTKTNGTGAIKSTTSAFYIGRSQFYWNGLIDDVRIYNYARTADQILQDYLNGASARLGD